MLVRAVDGDSSLAEVNCGNLQGVIHVDEAIDLIRELAQIFDLNLYMDEITEEPMAETTAQTP